MGLKTMSIQTAIVTQPLADVTLTKMRKTHWFLRGVSTLTVTFFLGSLIVPQLLYAQTAHDIKDRQQALVNDSKNLTESLQDFREHTRIKKHKVDKYLAEEGGYVEQALAFFGFRLLTMEDVVEYIELRARLKKHHQAQQQKCNKTRQWKEANALVEEMQKLQQAIYER